MKKQIETGKRTSQEKFALVVGNGENSPSVRGMLQATCPGLLEYEHNAVFAGYEVCDGSIGRYTDLNPVDELKTRVGYIPVRKDKITRKWVWVEEKMATHMYPVKFLGDKHPKADGKPIGINTRKVVTERYILYERTYKNMDGELVYLKPGIRPLVK